MKLTMLGTGHAIVYDYYNTCFILSENDKAFLIDCGGGNTVLTNIKNAGFSMDSIHDIFITHRHIDHLLGIYWLVRVISSAYKSGKYSGTLNIYAHDEVIDILSRTLPLLLPNETAALGDALSLNTLHSGEKKIIIGHEVTFFDIESTKARQFGFSILLDDGQKLSCCGDEPFNHVNGQYIRSSKWLMHEAFCPERMTDKYNPHKISHSTVKDACENAQYLDAANLILYHTEDETFGRRKELYIGEGKKYYSGNIYVPDDLEEIEL